MKKTFVSILALFLLSSPVKAEQTMSPQIQQSSSSQKGFEMRVDGLACPYCAYGIEKKFKKIKGVTAIDVDLKKGIVIVCALNSVKFNDKQLTQLFEDSGFTYRSMAVKEQCQAPKD